MHAALEILATWLAPVVAAIVLHDVAQSHVARWMGDEAMAAWRTRPRLTRYLDPLGSVVIPLALAFAHAPVFGWGRRLPLGEGRARAERMRRVVVALVGPLACLLHAIAGAIALGAVVAASGGVMPDQGAGWWIAMNLFNFILANACMATFHLIPLPPFDVGRALAELLPGRARGPLRLAGRGVALAVVAIVIAVPLLDPHARIGERFAAPVINAITGFVLGLVNLTV